MCWRLISSVDQGRRLPLIRCVHLLTSTMADDKQAFKISTRGEWSKEGREERGRFWSRKEIR